MGCHEEDRYSGQGEGKEKRIENSKVPAGKGRNERALQVNPHL
jgi:hypothetical protein